LILFAFDAALVPAATPPIMTISFEFEENQNIKRIKVIIKIL
jgi:hypothetical protein